MRKSVENRKQIRQMPTIYANFPVLLPIIGLLAYRYGGGNS